MTLTFNIMMGGALTGAPFNPARALGPMVATGKFTMPGCTWQLQSSAPSSLPFCTRAFAARPGGDGIDENGRDASRMTASEPTRCEERPGSDMPGLCFKAS